MPHAHNSESFTTTLAYGRPLLQAVEGAYGSGQRIVITIVGPPRDVLKEKPIDLHRLDEQAAESEEFLGGRLAESEIEPGAGGGECGDQPMKNPSNRS